MSNIFPANSGNLILRSNAFEHKESIPRKYTCEGENTSPELSWAGAPKGTKSFALIVDDPDAPKKTWVHWVVFNIPEDQDKLSEGAGLKPELQNNIKQGLTDFGKTGYGGPCPPAGNHRYFFKLYALDAMLNLDSGITKEDLLKAMEGHILAETELIGTYRKQNQ